MAASWRGSVAEFVVNVGQKMRAGRGVEAMVTGDFAVDDRDLMDGRRRIELIEIAAVGATEPFPSHFLDKHMVTQSHCFVEHTAFTGPDAFQQLDHRRFPAFGGATGHHRCAQ